MPAALINLRQLILAGLAAGIWVLVSGLLMAAVFGYREMKEAFDAIGLQIPRGIEPFAVHTGVRILIGIGVVALYALLIRLLSPGQALLAAAAFLWFFGSLLPLAVIVEWGLFSWSLAARMWAWSAGEILVAALIGRLLYHP